MRTKSPKCEDLSGQGAGKWENDEVKTFFKVLSGDRKDEKRSKR